MQWIPLFKTASTFLQMGVLLLSWNDRPYLMLIGNNQSPLANLIRNVESGKWTTS